MKTKNYIFIFYLVLILVLPAYSADKNGLSINLRMDKFSFYSNEKVELKMFVKNISGKQQDFIIYDHDPKGNHYLTFQPVVFDMSGNEAEIIVPYKLANMRSSDLATKSLKRVVTLAPDDSFVYEIDLKKIYKLKENTKYRIRGFFYPDVKVKQVIRSSNELAFQYTMFEKSEMASKMEPDPIKQQIEKSISPAEIVLLLLEAEKNKRWKRFLKYIHLKRFINAYPEFVRSYQMADEDEKLKKEQEFVIFLTRGRDDYILDYKIINQQIEDNMRFAYVDVVVDRYGARITDRYKYRYTLEKIDGLWLIINLEATVLKGVRK